MQILSNRPVIICGNPRSGTRMCANILNLHSKVCVTDEFGNVPQIKLMIDVQAKKFLEGRVDPSSILKRKSVIAMFYWAIRSNEKDLDKFFNSSIIVNKTPRSEQYFEIYELIFSVNKPLYIYCCRNAVDVITSIINLPNLQWNSLSPEEIFKNYKQSFRYADNMAKRAPDRFIAVSLDEIKRKYSLYEGYKDIFAFINLEIENFLIEKINRLKPANSMEKVKLIIGDKSDKKFLDQSLIDSFNSDSEYQDIAGKYRLLS